MDDLASNGFNVQIPYDDDQTTQTDGVSAKRFMRAKKKKKLTLANTRTITHIRPRQVAYIIVQNYTVLLKFSSWLLDLSIFFSPHCVFFVREQLNQFERYCTVSLTRIIVVAVMVCRKFRTLLSTMTAKNYLRSSIVVVRCERSF